MRVRLIVAVIAVSAVLLIAINAGDDSRDVDGGRNTDDGSVEPPQPGLNPTLLAAGQAGADDGKDPAQDPLKHSDPSESDTPETVPGARVVEVVPPPSLSEARQALMILIHRLARQSSVTTIRRLERTKPIRTTWSDVLLPEVLRQLSEQTGITIALGPGVLARGAEIRIADPLAGTRVKGDATVRGILDALAEEHEFTISIGHESVMLRDAREDAKPRLRYFDAKDLVFQKWGAKEGIEMVDRLDAVLPDLLRKAANVGADDTGQGLMELRNGILIARQPPAVLKRIGEVLDRWRAKPTALRDAYDGLMAKRHPTVSGAPPRRGGGGDTPPKDGKRR